MYFSTQETYRQKMKEINQMYADDEAAR